MSEFLPNIQLSWDSLSRFYDLDDNFFLLYISMYNDIIAPATRQNVIEFIERQLRKINALNIIIINFAGF
jgi:hypothetical protein